MTASASGHNQPDYVLTVNGQNITPKIGARLIELRLRESRGEQADQLDITLDDADGRMALPPTGAKITLQLGWSGGQMVDKGTYVVDEVEHGGAPDRLQIRARSANMGKELRVRGSRSWHDCTLGDVVGDIAADNGLPARVDPQLAALPVAHVDQTGESDLNFLTRLARENDAVCTVKKDHLVFLPTGSGATAGGQPLTAAQITRQLGDQHRYHVGARGKYDGASASWHDPASAGLQTVTAYWGKDNEDEADKFAPTPGAGWDVNNNVDDLRPIDPGAARDANDADKFAPIDPSAGWDFKELKDTRASQAEAVRAAVSEAQRIDRGAATLSLKLALARPALMPQTRVTVSGFKPAIDEQSWLIKSVEHSLGEQGFTTSIEMELTGSASGGKGKGKNKRIKLGRAAKLKRGK
jgi:phage protein D